MSLSNPIAKPPAVRMIGEVDHPDFRDAVALLRADAQIVTEIAAPPELIVFAQTRRGEIPSRDVVSLRRRWPLAGAIALLGSWCEGETRTGRPWPGIERLYWYEFPAWWLRQLALRAAGRCPDWARPGNSVATSRVVPDPGRNCGLIVISAPFRDTAAAVSDVLWQSGYATVWHPPRRPAPMVYGTTAGIWDGGQLDEHEAVDLHAFCQQLARDAAPVIALMDFPRRDRVDRALQLGAAAVLSKPWRNADLVATIEAAARNHAVEFPTTHAA